MPTEHNTPETPETAPDEGVVAREPGHRPDDTDPAAGVTRIDGETALRDWEGLPSEGMILVPEFTTPMRPSEQAWAMLPGTCSRKVWRVHSATRHRIRRIRNLTSTRRPSTGTSAGTRSWKA